MPQYNFAQQQQKVITTQRAIAIFCVSRVKRVSFMHLRLYAFQHFFIHFLVHCTEVHYFSVISFTWIHMNFRICNKSFVLMIKSFSQTSTFSLLTLLLEKVYHDNDFVETY